MANPKLTTENIKQKIYDLKGNVSAVARSFGCERSTIYAKIDKSNTLKKALSDSRETMLDNVESKLYQNAMSGDTTALIFISKTLGKSRGYVERQEVTGADGEKLEVVIKREG